MHQQKTDRPGQPQQQRQGEALERQIRSIVSQVSREKLLPKILWYAARELGSKKLVGYQKSVRQQYENELRCPLKYDPEEAKSDREKFREKVVRLMNNQLEVQYLQNVRLNDRTLVTYRGHELESVPVSTQKQFEMFRNFNERRFKDTHSNLFEDQLELDYPHLYQNKKQRCQTLNILNNKQDKDKVVDYLRIHDSHIHTQPSDTHSPPHKTPKKRQLLVQSARKKPLLYFNQKKTVGALIPHDEEAAVMAIMRQVGPFSDRISGGPFSDRISGSQLSVTRQSVLRWLKGLIEKPNRIADFLQLPEVLAVEQFWAISRKLRLMPLDHLQFMAFLYLDHNNDGYLCDYDLQHLSSLALTRPVLAHDYQRIKQSNFKKLLTKRQPYLQLYKLSEVTETTFFEWKKKELVAEEERGRLELQMKNRVLSSKQKHIFLDFSAFQQLYRADKPFLWYDLIMIFSGTAYQGLRYT